MTAPRPSPLRDRLAASLRIVLAAAMLMWPLLVAGRPTVFPDTGLYWWQGRTAIVQGFGIDRGAPNLFDHAVGALVIERTKEDFSTFVAARSPTYGALLFLTQHLGTLWLTAALQSLVTAAVFYLVWRIAAPKAAGWTFLTMMAALSAATSLAFYASFAMPDVFAGLGILITVALVLYWDRLGRWARLGLWGLLALSLTFHTSHLLLAILTLPVAVFALWRLGAPRLAILVRAGALAAAIGAATLGLAGAAAGMRALTGLEAHNPPFLTARLLADGPGRTYLRRACADADPFFLCRFKALPLDNSEDILWSDQPGTGVFRVSDFSDRLRLEAEQGRFVRAVILADPLGVASTAARNFSQQLTRFSVDDPLHNPCGLRHVLADSILRVLVVDLDRCGRDDRPLMPQSLLYGLHGAALILSAIVIWRLWRARRAMERKKAVGPDGLDDIGRLLAATGMVGAAVVFNAAICGVLSGPFPRYEARLIWLVPTLALMAGCAIAAPALEQFRGRWVSHRYLAAR